MTIEKLFGVPNALAKVLVDDEEGKKQSVERVVKEFETSIDALTFMLPDHDFNKARSRGYLETKKIGVGVPEQVARFLNLGNLPDGQRIIVNACSRQGIEMSVSLQVDDKRARFNIDQETNEPELLLEGKKDGKWGVVENDGKMSVDWNYLDVAIKIVSKAVEDEKA